MISSHSFSEIKSIDLHLSHSTSLSNSSLPHFEQYFIINLLNLYNSNIYKLLYHSTIFRTIDENATGNANKYGIRNSSYADIDNAYNVGGIKGVGNSLSSFITSKDLDNIKEFNRLVSEEGVSSQTAWYKTMQTSSSAAKELFNNEENLIKSGNSVIFSEEAISNAINTMTFSAKAGQVALKGLAIAGNMVVGILAGFVISKAIEGFDNLIHASEKCSERVKELSDNFKSEQNSITQHQSTISSIQDRYVELSKGVNNLGQNVSLTTDEFTEYNKICNQIADMFPTLVQGYDSQGNAILKYKTNVEELNKALLEEQKASAAKVINKKDDILNNYENTANPSIGDSLKKYFGGIFQSNDVLTASMISDQDKINKYKDLLTKSYDEIKELRYKIGNDSDTVATRGILKSLGIDKNTTESEFSEFRASLQAEITTTKSSIDEAVAGVKSLASSYLLYNDDYSSLSDEQISIISSMINNIDDKVVNSFGKDEKNVAKYVNNIVDLVNNSSDYVQNAITSWFTASDDTSDDKKIEWLDAIIKAYEDKGMEIPIYFTDAKKDLADKRKTLEKSVYELLKVKSSNYKKKVQSLSMDDLEIANNLNIPEGTYLSWDELIAKIKEAKEESATVKETPSANVDFKQAWKDLDSTDDDKLKNLKKDLTTLAESGKLTEKSFNKTPGAKTWLEQLGIDAETAVNKINELTDNSKPLSSLKANVKLVQDAFADKRDNGVAGSDTINAMEPEFGKLKSWKKYKETLGSTTSTLNECRKAQNELASEYINSNNFLSKLVKGTGEVDEKTKQYYTSQLKELGIKNAKDVVDQQIVNRQKEIAQAKSQEIIDIKTSSIDLQNATQDEIQSLIDETEQLEGNTNALKLYLLQKMMSKDDAFDTAESVNNLINLANECNASETVINNLKNALKNLQDNGNVQLSIGLNYSVNPISGTSIENSLIGDNFPTLGETAINNINQDKIDKSANEAKSENEKRLRKQNKKLQAKINALLKDAASSNSKSNGSSSSKSKSTKEFNWIDTLIDRTEKKAKRTVDSITDYANKKSKNKLYDKAIKRYKNLGKIYQQTSGYYLGKFNNFKISKNAKEDASWKNKIQNGDFSIDKVKNSKKADKITKAKDYYDQYQNYLDKEKDNEKTLSDLRKQRLDDDIAHIEAKSDRIQRLSDSVQNRIDYNDTLGLAISENSYKELIKYSKKQVKRWIDEKATYSEYLSTLKKGSTEYIETEQKIADCDSKIQDAQKSQLEWNQTIAQMPLEKFEKLGNVISSIITNLGNFNSLLESQGKKMTSSQILNEIGIRNQSIAVKDQEIAYNKGERFTNAIRSVIGGKYNWVYGENLKEYAKEADPIANNLRPLFEKLLSNEISLDDFYSKASEQTHMTVDALKQNKELNDILTSVPDLESEKYSLMQEQEEYTDKLIDIEISKYQELRDEIEKANDAKQKALELTEKEIALQKELENRTNLIYRNGQYVYESDSSAVREKQNDLDNYYAQQQLDKLDDIIDKLGDLKNTLNYREGTTIIGDYEINPSQLVEAAKRLILDNVGEIKGAYAKGTTSAKGGLSLVGEKGTELRVLNRGDGIIPAEITKNLMEFGVDPAKIIMDNLNKNIPDYKNIITPVNSSTDNSIHIDKVEMSGVNDVQSFMKELSHLTLDAQQRAYKR